MRLDIGSGAVERPARPAPLASGRAVEGEAG
jgi:hypothetical protein